MSKRYNFVVNQSRSAHQTVQSSQTGNADNGTKPTMPRRTEAQALTTERKNIHFMKTLLYCTLAMLAIACTPKKDTGGNADELSMLVGTYTNGTSTGIYTFRFNQATGTATALDSFAMVNPSYLTPSADGRFVYAVSETNDTTASLYALAFDKATGSLQLLNRVATGGEDPCYVATNGKEVLTANYSGGSMSVFSLRPDGSVEPLDTLFKGMAHNVDTTRQTAPHVHCTLFTPDGQYILATDFSADRIMSFALRADGIVPNAAAEATDIEPGSGPRHITFSPDGSHAYLINELSGKVIAFDYNAGSLRQTQAIAADTLEARGSADIHLSPDGRFLYASNRLKGDGIAIFAVNAQDGTLTKVGYQLTGGHPRNFNITPNGKYLLVACRDSNVIQVYERDTDTGLLTDTRRDIRLDMPVCIQFVD